MHSFLFINVYYYFFCLADSHDLALLCTHLTSFGELQTASHIIWLPVHSLFCAASVLDSLLLDSSATPHFILLRIMPDQMSAVIFNL